MEWKWFAVKTLFRSQAVGEPLAIDEHFDGSVDYVEERVVLYHARSHDEAIRRAENDAVKYSQDRHINPYGQTVVNRYLEACDSYELFDQPPQNTSSGLEVYSATGVVPHKLSDDDLISQRMGPDECVAPDPRRKKFLNREFSGSIAGAKSQTTEKQ
jgi:hypothetical protein